MILEDKGKVEVKSFKEGKKDIMFDELQRIEKDRKRVWKKALQYRDNLEEKILELGTITKELERLNIPYLELDINSLVNMEKLNEWVLSISKSEEKEYIKEGSAILKININKEPYQANINYKKSKNIYKKIEIKKLVAEKDIKELGWENKK